MSIFVSPSSNIDRFFLYTKDHFSLSEIQYTFIYSENEVGQEGSLEISPQSLSNSFSSGVLTKALIFDQSSGNSFALICDHIARKTCHLQRKIRLSGYTILRAPICARSRSVIIMAGMTARLPSRTQRTKKDIVSLVPLDASIQATGTPELGK